MTTALLLRCPSCGLANAVSGRGNVADTRCPVCASDLDPRLETRFHVAAGEEARGPIAHSDLVQEIGRGTVTAAMLLSEEGGPWIPGSERVDLFPKHQAVRPPPAYKMPPPRKRRPPPPAADRVPASVTAMAVLDYLAGVLFLALLAIAGAMGGLSYVPTLGLILLLIAVMHFGIGAGLKNGSKGALVVQLVLASIVGVIALVAMSNEGGRGVSLLALALAALPFFLLLNKEAREFF